MTTKSSKKLKQKTIDSHLSSQQPEHSGDQDGVGPHGSPTHEAEGEDSQSYHSSEASIPTTNASVSTMLDKLKSALFSDLQRIAADIRADIQVIGDRTAHLEENTEGILTAHNELADAHTALENKVKYLEGKIADNEDRDRRNNIRIRGIPENVSPQDLTHYVQKLFKSLIPSMTDADLRLDRTHRLPKPRHLPATIPRDVITRLHYFTVKDQIMQTRHTDSGRLEHPHPCFTERKTKVRHTTATNNGERLTTNSMDQQYSTRPQKLPALTITLPRSWTRNLLHLKVLYYFAASTIDVVLLYD
ncbi:Hypothetical predicted protein [Pelobates cultripes]|uniref:LINE-1 type transposase domain-containing 1 n=1 Tax=Pelobates cultripes TaxID=61616 RepID=A0AAD1TA83_PELCU|nr:Hypothetical predicted protein [Pelobates cultripes]